MYAATQTLHPPRRGFSPYFAPMAQQWSWHRAWVEHRRLNRLEPIALRDLGMSLADRASVSVPIIVARMRAGA